MRPTYYEYGEARSGDAARRWPTTRCAGHRVVARRPAGERGPAASPIVVRTPPTSGGRPTSTRRAVSAPVAAPVDQTGRRRGAVSPSWRRSAISAACTGIGQAGAAAQVVEVEVAGRGGPPATASAAAGRAGRSRGRAAAPAGCRRTGRRRCGRPPRSRPGAPPRAPRRTGRPRSAQQASCRPWVQTQKTGSSMACQPGRLARPEGRQVEVEQRPRVRRRPRSRATARAGSAYAANTRTPAAPGARPVPADQQRPDPRRGRAARAARSPTPSGSRLSRSASTPQGPGCSTSRKARTVEAVPATGRRRGRRLATAQRKPARSRDDLEQPFPDQPAAEHQPALRRRGVGEVGRA